MTFLSSLAHPSVTSDRARRRYVAAVSLACLIVALGADVVNQLTFYVDAATCLRSWAVTTAIALSLALPISNAIGQAHLELHRAKVAAEELSRTDQLTGLLNRRALMDAAPTFGRSVFALVIADIDRFKLVNDTYGHVVGDEVIRSVAQRMAAELSGLGLLARLGGEEFAFLCPDTPVAELMGRLAAFRDRIATTPIIGKGFAVHVTVSAGVAVSCNREGFDELYCAADHALYSAKSAGRNRVVLADSVPRMLGLPGRDAVWPAA